ncbi:MAG TPA: Hsp20/alpha crystallin family protein [Candidatus Binatia bacterium]|nr:Hsp20/alpha crystallin family protein [Candidatus Binatia bacterium]
MAAQTVATTSGQQPMTTSKERTRAHERHIQPPVDIYETPDGLVLLADLPGVASNDLEVRIEDNTLTILGKAKHAFTSEPIYREFELANFFRQFELSEEVDQGKINARLKHGVLMLELPRAEKAKPRQIPVQVDGTSESAKQQPGKQESAKAAAA